MAQSSGASSSASSSFGSGFKTWFHRWGSPRWFYERSFRWSFWFGWSAFILLTVGVVWGLGFADMERDQGNSFRIIYIHVPNSLMSMSNYVLMAIAGAVGMIWKIKLADWAMNRMAIIGSVFATAALFTGSVWGKTTFGTWLEPTDPKVMFTILMWLFYMGILALKNSFPNEATANKAATYLALVGVVNIPLIYFASSIVGHQGLHQDTGTTFASASMMWPFFIMLAAGYCFYAWVLITSIRAEILKREAKTQWVKDLVAAKAKG